MSLTRYRRYIFNMIEGKDYDVIAYLDSLENKTDAIRRALRKQIEEEDHHEQETEESAPQPKG